MNFETPDTIYVKYRTLVTLREKVAIVNALQLEAAWATQAHCRFSNNAMPSLKSLNLYVAVL